MGNGRKEKFGPPAHNPATEEFPSHILGEDSGPENIDWAKRADLRAEERFLEEGEFDEDD